MRFARGATRAGYAALACLCLLTTAARADTVFNDWNYAIDSQNDGSGGSSFEYRGLAFRQQGNTAYFAISGGMPLNGVPHGGALNGNIGGGDLFLNFSAHNMDSPAEFNDPNVFAIRFNSTNDSLNNVGGSNTTLGVFGSVTPVSLTAQNVGYGTLQSYLNAGFGRNTGAMGDLESSLADVVPYFGNGTMYPNIQSGTLLGGISLLDNNALSGLGLDFGHFGANPGGNNIYGFSFDSSLLPTGNFTASLFLECINDGMALDGAMMPTPEPGSLALLGTGLATVGGLGWRRRRSAVSRLA